MNYSTVYNSMDMVSINLGFKKPRPEMPELVEKRAREMSSVDFPLYSKTPKSIAENV